MSLQPIQVQRTKVLSGRIVWRLFSDKSALWFALVAILPPFILISDKVYYSSKMGLKIIRFMKTGVPSIDVIQLIMNNNSMKIIPEVWSIWRYKPGSSFRIIFVYPIDMAVGNSTNYIIFPSF